MEHPKPVQETSTRELEDILTEVLIAQSQIEQLLRQPVSTIGLCKWIETLRYQSHTASMKHLLETVLIARAEAN